MFVYLQDIANCMDSPSDTVFFDVLRGECVDVGTDNVSELHFLAIPKVNENELAVIYAKQLQWRKIQRDILQKETDHKFGSYFHRMLIENGLYDDWISFRQNMVLSFAKDWCEQNHIPYSSKDRGFGQMYRGKVR